MGKRIGYGKLGRSMPLTLEDCGNLGGDVEMVAVVKTLALRHPDDTFILIGRNSGELPGDVGLPSNVYNPWVHWAPHLRRLMKERVPAGPLTIESQITLRDIFREITEATFLSLDGIVMWVGQHGTTNTPIPTVADPNELTKPQDWCAYYASFILQGINAWRDVDPIAREEIWLNADSRNRHKMRDLKWPLRHPILTQYKFEHPLKHYRYGDTRTPYRVWGDDEGWQWGKIAQQEANDNQVWKSTVRNEYARLEINGLLPRTPFGDLISFNDNWDRPGSFGLFINEARKQVSSATKRVDIVKEWVLPQQPHFIHGTWSSESLTELGVDIKPAPWNEYYPRLHSVRATLTTPSSGSGFATAKPWEAFAGGTVCFFHPKYDDQDNILGDASPSLRYFLRVNTADELAHKIQRLNEDEELWIDVVRAQRAHFVTAARELRYMRLIEERLGYGAD